MTEAPKDAPRPLPSQKDLARALGVHPASVGREIAKGKIKATRIGRATRIPWREYDRLVLGE
jgi:Helix-turn-helix domain